MSKTAASATSIIETSGDVAMEEAMEDAAAGLERSPAHRHFAHIEAALQFLETHAEAQPSLADVAAHVGFSPSHFQRVFSEWVGVSPKKYLSYLTLGYAKSLLAARRSVLDATLETGLSSPSRLHDLFVAWEAMTPGAYAAGGAGLALRFGWFDSPFGAVLAVGADRGLTGLAFAAEHGPDATFEDMRGRWPKADYSEDADAIAPWVASAFALRKEATGAEPTPLQLIGAPFQIKVWEALLATPPGHVTTYSDIAARIGAPKAVRAVGSAVGRNPVSWLIPCHRAIRKSGALGGYRWGLGVKRAMLAYESARFEAGAA